MMASSRSDPSVLEGGVVSEVSCAAAAAVVSGEKSRVYFGENAPFC